MPASFPTATGELADLIRALDWSRTAIGPIEGWPTSLRTAVEIVLQSRVPIVMLWGRAGTLIYNDAYAVFAGPRHPTQLGLPVLDAWPEVAAFNAQVMRVVLGEGGTLAYRDQHLVLMRRGVPEDTWMDLDYSPIPGEDGRPAGVLSIVVETTARHRSEAALMGVGEQLQLARDTGAIIGTWLWTMQDDRVTGDQSFAATLNMDPDRLLAGVGVQAILDAILPDDLGRIRGLIGDAVRGGGVLRAQFRTLDTAGGHRWIEARGHCETDASGRPLRFPGVLVDIDERRRAEDRLIVSEASLRLATEAAEIGTWDLDLTTDVLTWSDRTKAMFGFRRESPPSMRDFYAGLHPDDLASTAEKFAAAIDPSRRAFYDAEYRTIGREDGVVRWIAAKGRGLFDADGVCVRALGTAIDITARMAAEADQLFLLGLADRLRDLTDPLAATSVAEDRLRDMLGAAEVRLLPASSSPARPGQVMQTPVIRQGKVVANLVVRAHGPRAWSERETALCREVAERSWIAVERVRAEASLRELNATLEQRVEQRTAELQAAEAALRQAQKMEAVGQLTGGIAHDFNNMLSVIVGGLGLAQRRLERGDTNIGRFIEAALEGAARAGALTQRLLAFARQQPLRPEVLDPVLLIRGMADMLARSLGEQVRVEVDLPPGIWRVRVDRPQLENAILNLAVNGRDAMEGSGRLLIQLSNMPAAEAARHERGLDASDHVVIDVTDTGSGMPPEVAAQAFDPFFTTKEVGRGTGLGLSQVYGFVRQSGGQAAIRSEVGRRTTVSLYLPRDSGSLSPPPMKPQPSLATDQRGAGEAVLVVEDEERVRQLSVTSLRELGYTVLAANTAQEALRLLDAHPEVALLFTDIVMPVMNGRELADAARERRPGLKVLYTSGYTRNEVVPQEDLLSKPFDLSQLAAKVRGALAGYANAASRASSDLTEPSAG